MTKSKRSGSKRGPNHDSNLLAITPNKNSSENPTSEEKKKCVIDSMLEKRPQLPPCHSELKTSLQSDDECTIDESDIIKPGPLVQNISGSTLEEKNKALFDVYGHPVSNDVVISEQERIAEIDREVCRLKGNENTAAIKRAMAINPMLLLSSPHARAIARDLSVDSKEAAIRLARYWECRKAMFGDAAFSEGVFTEPTYEDYLRCYDRCLRVSSDPSADEGSREVAAEYVNCVNRAKIEALDMIVDSASPDDADALQKAKTCAPQLADTDEVKLRFLRRDDFIETKAAVRMMKYWKTRFMLFGEEMACRRITYADMANDEEVLKCGVIRVMPGTDEFGRSIIVFSNLHLKDHDWDGHGLMRIFFYIVHLAMERESIYENGLVGIVNHIGSSLDFSEPLFEVRRTLYTILHTALPIKMIGAHIFLKPSTWYQKVLAASLSIITRFSKMRLVMHAGQTEDENKLYLDLQQYGVQKDQVPSELGGDETIESWCQWLDNQRGTGV